MTTAALTEIAETHHLLPPQQMGARRTRSTETAIQLLLSQIRTAWQGQAVATVMSMDMSGAFDHVVHARLLHILRTKRIPESIVGWIASFISNRSTSLSFDNRQSSPLPTTTGIPQGSPISPILFLFYNSELVDTCNHFHQRISAIGFVDDVNIIAWGHSARSNNILLKRVHDRCLEWADRHGAKFAPEKYELIHLSRRRVPLDATLRLGTVVIQPSPSVRVLGLHLDSRLNWTAHRQALTRKLSTQCLALHRLTGSTWGLPSRECRRIYIAVIRPAMAYMACAWYQPLSSQRSHLLKYLQTVQNDCLRVVLGAFRATPITTREALAFIPPLDLWLTQQVYQSLCRLQPHRPLLDSACRHIAHCLSFSLPPFPAMLHPAPLSPLWPHSWCPTFPSDTSTWALSKKQCTDITLHLWKTRWNSQTNRSRGSMAVHWPPGPGFLSITQSLNKARSSLLVQLTTGKIGLHGFLHTMKVPDVPTPHCPHCSYHYESPHHITVYCPHYNDRRHRLTDNGPIDFHRLLTTSQGALRLTTWWFSIHRLEQFSLASRLDDMLT